MLCVYSVVADHAQYKKLLWQLHVKGKLCIIHICVFAVVSCGSTYAGLHANGVIVVLTLCVLFSVHRRVMQLVSLYACVCVYMSQKIACLASSRSRNLRKSYQGAFFLHIDIVNVTLNCQFTPDQVLLLFLCSCLCALLRVVGLRGAHMCSLIGRCVCYAYHNADLTIE